MHRKISSSTIIFLIISAILLLVACGQNSTGSPDLWTTSSANSSPTATIIPTAISTAEPTSIGWPFTGSVDIVSYQSNRNGAWFSEDASVLPKTELTPEIVLNISDSVVNNRENGNISPTLISGYFFLQWPVSRADLEPYIHTIRALFVRSANIRFVDYPNLRVFSWDDTSEEITSDIYDIVALCNEKNVPVFLEMNYSDYVPGAIGTGIESLQPADNIMSTIDFLRTLDARGLQLTGLTFGNEIGDDGGFGTYKPSVYNSDVIGKFISYSRAIKTEFPEMKIYGFGSYIGATRGQANEYFDLLQKVRGAELEDNIVLLDGFTFNESYVYMNEQGVLLDSQFILDDPESLYRDAPVYRYDVWGNTHPNQDRAYLPDLIDKTFAIFERPIEIGITEYLPAGSIPINEFDTSSYDDIDFIIHYCDVIGIYAELGLDFVSREILGNTINHHKSPFDREGNIGTNYAVQEQLAQYFSGEILQVNRNQDYELDRVKVYATRQGRAYFIMMLNKDVDREHIVKLMLPDRLELIIRIPQRSFTSIRIDENNVIISGIENGKPPTKRGVGVGAAQASPPGRRTGFDSPREITYNGLIFR